jgi:hypothetical protein
MITLEELKPSLPLVGLEPACIATNVSLNCIADGEVQVFYRGPGGAIMDRLLGHADKQKTIAVVDRPSSVDGDGSAFQLTCEAKRIDLAFKFAPMMALHTSDVDPLPHEITAVYKSVLPKQPLRFVLADDPRAGQTSATYIDTLNRLSDSLHYLKGSGDQAQDTTRFWFDTRANLRREMKDQKRRFDEASDMRGRIAEAMRKMLGKGSFFDSNHTLTATSDVPDDSNLRLVALSPDHWYARDEDRTASYTVVNYVRNNGTKPRYRGNRLIFLPPDMRTLSRPRELAGSAPAWNSILEDVREGRLKIDLLQKKQAKKELAVAEDVVPGAARECFRWLLCAVQNQPTDPRMQVEVFPLNTTGASPSAEIQRVCLKNELLITTWSPIHVRTKLREQYWKDGKAAMSAVTFWQDSLRYPYLPGLKNKESLPKAIEAGANSPDFFANAHGQEGDKYDGFKEGEVNIQFDTSLLLIDPIAAASYAAAVHAKAAAAIAAQQATAAGSGSTLPSSVSQTLGVSPSSAGHLGPHRGHRCKAKISPRLTSIQTQHIQSAPRPDRGRDHQSSDDGPNASLTILLEINAKLSNGAADQTKHAISKNATALAVQTRRGSESEDPNNTQLMMIRKTIVPRRGRKVAHQLTTAHPTYSKFWQTRSNSLVNLSPTEFPLINPKLCHCCTQTAFERRFFLLPSCQNQHLRLARLYPQSPTSPKSKHT